MADEGILFITIILYFLIKVTMCVCICTEAYSGQSEENILRC